MASQPSHLPHASSFLQQLSHNSTNMGAPLPLFLPFILGFSNVQNNSNPPQDSSNQETLTDRVILINPFTQSMVVIHTSSSTNLEAFFRDFFSAKDGQPPASKSSIEAMPTVEISEDNCEGECVICLENWEVGHVATEMPCKHRFHGDCVKKWLKIHGSCPVCRFNMPVEEVRDSNKSNGSDDSGMGREIRVSFSIGSGRISQNSDDNQRGSDESAHS